MGKNIFERHGESTIFRDERFLYPEFVPERLPHRDAEIESLAFALKPVALGRKPQNPLVLGRSGTGKTVVVRFVLKELEEFSDRAKPLYLNCFEFNTRHGILTEISNFLGEPTPRRGIATDEAYSRLVGALKGAAFTPVIVLDEVDQLVHGSEANRLFYDLLRVSEHVKAGLGLVLISNDFSFSARLDARVQSSLSPHSILFEPYSPMQLKDILGERAQRAFAPSAIDADAISIAAGHAARLGGDARIAIECLLRAGRLAEEENATRLLPEHLKRVFAEVDATALHKYAGSLSEHEKKLLFLIPSNAETTSGRLFAAYQKSVERPLSERSFRSMLSRLESFGLIGASFTKEGARGRTRKISLLVPKQAVLREFGESETNLKRPIDK
jgi:cell division control protein 6